MASLRWLAEGFAAGVVVAAPIGPMALLCIRRTLDRGWPSGAASGLGIALADGTYATVAVLGLGAVSGLLREARWIEAAGGLVLMYVGLRAALSQPAARAATARSSAGLGQDFASTYVLTLANPPTILTFAGLGAALGVAGRVGGGWLVAGVFAGSLAWWLFLSGLLAAIRRRLPDAFVSGVTRGSGLLLAALGLAAVVSALWSR
ncbi:MAG TPA: LysE family transporter [Candidatus Dormibacteraeota bacterium]